MLNLLIKDTLSLVSGYRQSLSVQTNYVPSRNPGPHRLNSYFPLSPRRTVRIRVSDQPSATTVTWKPFTCQGLYYRFGTLLGPKREERKTRQNSKYKAHHHDLG